MCHVTHSLGTAARYCSLGTTTADMTAPNLSPNIKLRPKSAQNNFSKKNSPLPPLRNPSLQYNIINAMKMVIELPLSLLRSTQIPSLRAPPRDRCSVFLDPEILKFSLFLILRHLLLRLFKL
ncbi:hypothetical protein KFK09_002099 [Dendrobium nobile]|uniref:Uncharacterized protein n=1 Tax=Dendrobium nobile TaxID=94219 RepID=A0A8T3C9B3_DENNO|nr:hypothetical protein KFK09_002099 [Dendrobium nobile]